MTETPASNPTPRALPFTALRAVEAAVRHRSYSAAARELQITHAAISQAIKRLEKELDLKLFARTGQQMLPSDVALQMASAYSQATDTLYRSLDGIWQRSARAVLALPPDLGRLWFAPRLHRLSRDLSGLTVETRARSSSDMGQPGTSDIGLVLGFEPVIADGWGTEAIAGIGLFPVCSPAFLTANSLTRPRDFVDVPLLSERRWPWSVWLDATGEGRRKPAQSLAFDDANLTLDAAVRGRGVALTHIFHAEEHLRAGTLVRPVSMVAATTDALYLSWRTGSSEGVRRMVEWVRQELGRSVSAGNVVDPRY